MAWTLRLLIQEMLHYCSLKYPNTAIKCSPQHYLTNFYESFGFKSYGKPYDEDGIIHIAMQLA
ncbi:MAG: GNAT family N-acetyltransferase [Legionella sp.]|jgi:ElaA protein